MAEDKDEGGAQRPAEKNRRRAPPEPSQSASNTAMSGGLSAPFSNVTIGRDLIQYTGSQQPGEARWDPDSGVRSYLDWLAAQEHRVPLRGVGGGDLYLTLDETYVSLNFEVCSMAMELLPKRGGRERHRPTDDGGGVDLPALFARLSAERCQHALILGEPGSGKSTALRKLSQLVGEQARRARGEALAAPRRDDTELHPGTLGERYLPILVRLREWRESDESRPLKGFIGRELGESVKSATKTDAPALEDHAIDALWDHGELLLLLDGLDEITSLKRRAGFCDALAQTLAQPSNARLRVVITCRYAGYDEDELQLATRGFGRAELLPLSAKQAKKLIQRWFTEVARANQERLTLPDARRLAKSLDKALEDSRFADYRRAMYATPLIVTLLCVVHLRGEELPRSRARFYEACLRVLLGSWQTASGAGKRVEPLLSTDQAIDLLRPLAYRLHRTEDAGRPERSEQLGRALLLDQLAEGLDEQGLDLEEADVLVWLYERAGVLDQLAPGSYGFFHLGIQEYLAALEAARRGPGALRELAARAGDSWWREVTLLAASLPGRGAFAPLMAALLKEADLEDRDQWQLLRHCVLEGCFDPAPFVERFGAKELDDGPRLRATLRLLHDHRHPELVESLRALAERTDADPGARGDAAQLVAKLSDRTEGDRPYHVAVVGLEDALPQVRELVRLLRQRTSLRVWPEPTDSPALAEIDSQALRGDVGAVVVVVGQRLPWGREAPEVAAAKLRTLTRRQSFTAVFAPESPAELGERPRKLGEVFDMRRAWDAESLLDHLQPSAEPATVAQTTGGLIAELHTPSVEPTTGMRLVWVPGGTFMMGSDDLDDDSRPPHLVSVGPFWLGEAAVTNQQYRMFVAQTGHREPPSWRTRRFSDPQQPVVAVSWEDAVAFCRWLSERSGWAVDLPSEAQWEFAARGTDGRRYPWGFEEPDATRAHFAQGRSGCPAIAGSLPGGRGPFGTLDQAGNVWEWCKDVWDAGAYKERARPPAVTSEPLVSRSPRKGWHSLRGGCWRNEGGALAAAFRDWDWRVLDLDVVGGFRVLVSREPVDL